MNNEHSPAKSKSLLEVVGRHSPDGDALTAPTFGVWPQPPRLLVVRVDLGDETGAPIFVSPGEPACAAFLERVASLRGELVVADALLDADPIGQRALEHRLPIWVVPLAVLDSIRYLTGTRSRSPRRYATLLARLPHYIWLQSLLRRVPPRGRGDQLGLL